MKRLVLMTSAVALGCLSLAACTSTGMLNPTASSDLQSALAVACPVLNVVQSSNIALNAYQKSALTTLALACPPNPPPTSAIVAASDIVSAYTILQPLMKQ